MGRLRGQAMISLSSPVESGEAPGQTFVRTCSPDAAVGSPHSPLLLVFALAPPPGSSPVRHSNTATSRSDLTF